MQMGESSKATVLQNEELYTWICSAEVRVACLTSLLAFRILGIRQHARRFSPRQLDEGWRSPKTFVLFRNHAKRSGDFSHTVLLTPSRYKKLYAFAETRYRVRPQAGNLDILQGFAVESPIPSPVRGESTIWDGWQWRKIHKTVMSLGGHMQREKEHGKVKRRAMFICTRAR